jgi:hypothetical protein
MKKRTKILIYIGISPLVAAGLLYCFLFLHAAGLFRALTLKSDLDRLLHHTDHPALLAACRNLMKEGYTGQYNLKGTAKHPDADKLPKVILALRPSYVSVLNKEGRVHIEMWGGMSHFGVMAYAEDFKDPHEGFKRGNKKLIDGLWFCSDFIDLSDEDI